MILHYIKIAWRNILNNKCYAVINISGLTIGLTVGLLILFWVNDELNFDRFNTKADHIYQVDSQIGTGSSRQVWLNASPPLATYALREVPGVQNAARLFPNRDYLVFKYKEKSFEIGKYGNYYADPSIFKMFDFKLLKGKSDRPFPDSQSIIITQTIAKAYFGDADPIGKVIKADNKDNYTVTGVMSDFPENSSVKADMFFSMEAKRNQYSSKGAVKSMDEDWDNYYGSTFLQLQAGVSAESIMDKLTKIHVEHQPGADASKVKFVAEPLTRIHLYDADGNATGMQTVRVFFIVATLILLIACINYVNLSTARAMLRSKEVSVRKIIGAERTQLFAQFFIETLLFFSIALISAFILIVFLMPLYNGVSGKQMHFNLLDSNVWKVVGITITVTLAASSIYPALLLSSFKPLHALKGKLSLGLGNSNFRKVLVVCQFIFSVGLIISTLIINGQLKYIREKNLGYDRSFAFSFTMRGMQKNYEAIRAELLTHPGIKDIASSNDNIISANNTTSNTDWDGKQPNQSFLVHPITVDKHYLDFFKLKMAQGEQFSGIASDSAHFILNQTAVKESGIKDPIGKSFTLNYIKGTIIGVIKDFHFASLKKKIEPAVFAYQPAARKMFVRTTGKDALTAISSVAQSWNNYNAGFPFDYKFMDENYDTMYKVDQRSGILFNAFSAIAILISCLGLFGLAAYTAQVKVKEIGIRKVLGASVANIITMLSKDFLILVVVSLIIASPIAWIMMNKWLQEYTYRIQIQWWVFIFAGASAMSIAVITISSQAIKAALANPVKSLRSE